MKAEIIIGSWARLYQPQKSKLLSSKLESDVIITLISLGVNQYVAKAAIEQQKDLIAVTAGAISELPPTLLSIATRYYNAGATVMENKSKENFGPLWRNTLTYTLLYATKNYQDVSIKIIGTPKEWTNERAAYFHILRQARVLNIPAIRYKLTQHGIQEMKPWVPVGKPTDEVAEALPSLCTGESISLSSIREVIQPQEGSKSICTAMRCNSNMLEIVMGDDIVWFQPNILETKLTILP